MAYQWDKNKAAINLRKHGIDFADAVAVFSDDLAISTSDERDSRKSDLLQLD
jgi:uncharacterized protein